MIISYPAGKSLFLCRKTSIYYVYFSLVLARSLIRSYRSHVCFIACEMLPEGFSCFHRKGENHRHNPDRAQEEQVGRNMRALG